MSCIFWPFSWLFLDPAIFAYFVPNQKRRSTQKVRQQIFAFETQISFDIDLALSSKQSTNSLCLARQWDIFFSLLLSCLRPNKKSSLLTSFRGQQQSAKINYGWLLLHLDLKKNRKFVDLKMVTKIIQNWVYLCNFNLEIQR